ncbi:MAG: hypothetical protein WC681_09625, partial [Sterolibacterium sp.]
LPRHPAAPLADAGCTLRKLEGFHPDPQPIKTALAALDLDKSLAIYVGADIELLAYLETPRGLRELD